MKAIEEILRKAKYDGATGVISVYVSDLESIQKEFEQLQKETMTKEELKAKELFEKFNRVGLQQRDEAKECALICVDDKLELLGRLKKIQRYKAEKMTIQKEVDALQKVKQILTDKY